MAPPPYPIDNAALRHSRPPETVQLLRKLQAATTGDAVTVTVTVTERLDAAVRDAQLPPAVFGLWLRLRPAASSSLAVALRQTHSAGVRHAAVVELARALGSASAEDTWRGLGGARGLAEVMSGLGVGEVDRLCRLLGKRIAGCGGGGGAGERRRARMTELLGVLTRGENPDGRALRKCYALLVPGCTAEAVRRWEAEQSGGGDGEEERRRKEKKEKSMWPKAQKAALLRGHAELYEEKFQARLFAGKAELVDWEAWGPLTRQNLEFAERILEQILRDGSRLACKPATFIEKLAQPLSRQIARRKTEGPRRVQLLGLLVDCFEKDAELSGLLELNAQQGVISSAVELWNRERRLRPDVERSLIRLLSFMPKKEPEKAEEVLKLVAMVSKPLRYRLLCLLLKHLRRFDVDIENATAQDFKELAKFRLLWLSTLFTVGLDSRDAGKALALFRNLVKADTKNDLPSVSRRGTRTVSTSPAEFGKSRGDAVIVEAILRQRSASADAAWLDECRREIDERRRKSASSRDADERSFWALSAMHLSVAIGDLKCYKDTLLWARRFNKDFNTVRQIYRQSDLETTEGLDLLSGVADVLPDAGERPQDLKDRVDAGNEVLLQLLETATMALREPSFRCHDWESITSTLPQSVVQRRLDWVSKSRVLHEMSDEEVYDNVWEPTLRMLVGFEATLLKLEHEALEKQSPSGIVQRLILSLTDEVKPHTWKFLDELAKARDGLWRQHRSAAQPETLTLAEPWPRGLVVQHLCPQFWRKGSGDADKLEYRLPYVQSRARSVVFCDARRASEEVHESDQIKETVGVFIDSYKSALNYWVNGYDPKQDRTTRYNQAWEYATNSFTNTQGTGFRVLQAWEQVFKGAVKGRRPSIGVHAGCPWPRFPEASEVGAAAWDPVPPAEEQKELGKRGITFLDCMLKVGPSHVDLDRVLVEFSRTPKPSPYPIWDIDLLPKSPSTESRDSLVAAAMLYINTRVGSDASLLMHGYPSSADQRFPAVYLDEDFLERRPKGDLEKALRVLERLLAYTPAPLLERLAQSLFNRVKNNAKSGRDELVTTMTVLRLLGRSDQPWLALPFIENVVLEGQGESSWHRLLLNSGYLCYLPADVTKDFFSRLSATITNKLREQASRAATAPKNPEGSGPPPTLVKVTTVKMIAALLGDAPFIDGGSSCDLLGGIFSNSSHIDIRTATIDSLLGLLKAGGASSSATKAQVLTQLERHAVPIAASLDERRVLTEDDWAAAEGADGLQNVAWSGYTPHRPVLRKLVLDAGALEYEPDVRGRMAELVLQILDKSVANNTRWMELFWKHTGLKLPAGETFPIAPAEPMILISIFKRWRPWMTRSAFEMFRALILESLDRSSGLAAITRDIHKRANFRKNNALRHWYDMIGNAHEKRSWLLEVASFLARHKDLQGSQVRDGITKAMLQRLVYEGAEVMITKGLSRGLGQLNDQEDYIETLFARATDGKHWRKNTLSTLRDILTLVESLRTDEWQRGRRRVPAFLADGLRLDMLLATTPAEPKKGVAAAEEAAELVRNVEGLLRRLEGLKVPYHGYWEYLKAQLEKLPKGQLVGLAIELGRKSAVGLETAPMGVAGCLRVELASHLLCKGDAPATDALVEEARGVVRGWRESGTEYVRMVGLAAGKELVRTRRGRKLWYKEEEEEE